MKTVLKQLLALALCTAIASELAPLAQANSVQQVMSANAPAFTPLSLSPALWFDGSDATTMYDATSGGSLVAADGSIYRWEDKSGNARHLTKATALQPIRKTAVKNGKDVARFDGTKYMGLASAYSLPTSHSYFIVVTKTSSVLQYQDQLATTTGNGYAYNSNKVQLGGATGDPANSTSMTNSTYYLFACVVTAGSVQFYRNAATDGTGSGYAAQSVGYVGGRVAGENLTGDICEMLVFPSALSSTDRQKVETYLNSKWAIY